jgi:hypothetical protein
MRRAPSAREAGAKRQQMGDSESPRACRRVVFESHAFRPDKKK